MAARRDMPKLPCAEKVLWLREELGDDASLPEFCRKFLELLGDKIAGQVPQKAACLKLYALYRPESPEAAWKAERDLPPRELVEFQRVWAPNAPARCEECCRPLRDSGRQRFCGDRCENAGVLRSCNLCKRKGAPCSTCRLLKRTWEPPSPPTRLDRLCDTDNLRRYWQTVLCDSSVDPGHVPAWKRRRRS